MRGNVGDIGDIGDSGRLVLVVVLHGDGGASGGIGDGGASGYW